MKIDLSPKKEQIVTGLDNVIIRRYIAGITGGRTLNVEGFPLDVISAGTVIIEKEGDYRPHPVKKAGDVYVYDTLTAGYSVVGVLVSSIAKAKPAAAIMNRGEVNVEAVSIAYTETIKAALPLIVFTSDKEA